MKQIFGFSQGKDVKCTFFIHLSWQIWVRDIVWVTSTDSLTTSGLRVCFDGCTVLLISFVESHSWVRRKSGKPERGSGDWICHSQRYLLWLDALRKVRVSHPQVSKLSSRKRAYIRSCLRQARQWKIVQVYRSIGLASTTVVCTAKATALFPDREVFVWAPL